MKRRELLSIIETFTTLRKGRLSFRRTRNQKSGRILGNARSPQAGRSPGTNILDEWGA